MAKFCQTNSVRFRNPDATTLPLGGSIDLLCASALLSRNRSSRWTAAWTLGLFIFSTGQVSAERFDFDLVTLPTDLIATIVNIEDDIVLANQEQPKNSSSTQSQTTTVDSVSPATETADTVSTASIESSGSIFSDARSTQIVTTDKSTPDQGTVTVVAAMTESVSTTPASDTITEDESPPAQTLVEESLKPAIADTTDIEPQPEVMVAAIESPEKASTGSSIFDDIQSDEETVAVLIVEHPVSASEAADMPDVPNESQGLIVLTEPEPEKISEEVSERVTESTPTATDTRVAAVPDPIAINDEATNSLAQAENDSESQNNSEVDATIQSEPDKSITEEPAQEQVAAAVQTGQELPNIQTVTEPEAMLQVVTADQEDSINEDEIIIAWATAWSNNQTEDYLAFYADDFQPADKNQDRKTWEEQRRKRLKNKKIRIIVSNAEVYRVEGNVIEVRFTQRYTSASYKDRVIKSMEMTETDKGWQFLSEKTVKKLPFE